MIYAYIDIFRCQHICVGSSNESLALVTPRLSRPCFSWGNDTQREGARWISFPRTLALERMCSDGDQKSDQFVKRLLVPVFKSIVIMVI